MTLNNLGCFYNAYGVACPLCCLQWFDRSTSLLTGRAGLPLLGTCGYAVSAGRFHVALRCCNHALSLERDLATSSEAWARQAQEQKDQTTEALAAAATSAAGEAAGSAMKNGPALRPKPNKIAPRRTGHATLFCR